MASSQRAVRGALLTMLGGVLWGFSGACGQYLLQRKGLSTDWLVPVRLLSGGVLLLLFCAVRQGAQVLQVWRHDARRILVFGLLGMSMCQYTYYRTIAVSNAGTATVLQYLGPVLIVLYLSARLGRPPRPLEIASVVLALCGTFLLTTHGNPATMVISPAALFWGLLSAVAQAVYTVQPGPLLARYGAPVVTGWGMLAGGILLFSLRRSWTIPVHLDAGALAGLAAVILLGTVGAFCAFLEGVRCVGPKKGSLYALTEPAAATIFSVAWLGASFAPMDLAGFACILSTLFLLAFDKQPD